MTTWNIDPDHTVAAFKVRHLMIANVRGQFNAIHGTVHFNPEDPASLALEARVEVAGLYTGIRKRDEHLRSPDFFAADTFPDIFFHSTLARPAHGSGQHCTRPARRPAERYQFAYGICRGNC